MKTTAMRKLLLTCMIAIMFFGLGTYFYMTKYYKKDIYESIQVQEHKYIKSSNTAITNSQRAKDTLMKEHYINQSIEDYYIADSLDEQLKEVYK
jgi:hypothetical protein